METSTHSTFSNGFKFVQAGQKLEPGQKFYFTSKHLFPASEPNRAWVATEQIWYSSLAGKADWYQSDAPQNEDARMMGTIHLDMSKLQAHVDTIPTVDEGDFKQFEITLRVGVEMMEGFRHTLRIKARWAPGFESDERGATFKDDQMDVDEIAGGDINIAAAFKVSAI